jgi:NADPH-dependent 2,4-dienoyl-CoA reductase/sulfur reductase-like enzyme
MIVIVGLGTAAVYATRWITALNRDEEVTIIEMHSYESYSPCGLPLTIENNLDFELLKHPFPKTKRINVMLEHQVVEIEPSKRTLKVKDLKTEELKIVNYDKLFFVPGADPLIPPIKNISLFLNDGVYVLKTIEDGIKIENYLKENLVSDIAVVGAGAIGLEIAYALKKRGYKVTVYEMLAQCFPKALDSDMVQYVEEFLKDKEIAVYLNSKVEEILLDQKLILVNGQKKNADMVILATGVLPNSQLLKNKVSMFKNFIEVDEKMRTTDPYIYAAGDVIITKNAVDQHGMIVQLATTAAKQGIVAGINMAGGTATYNGAYGTFVSQMGDFEVATTGMSEEEVKQKFEVVTAKIKGTNKPEYAGGHSLALKVICDKNGRVLGAQAVGKNAADKINIISMAIKNKGTIQDLSSVELAYCPSVSELYDVVHSVADVLLRKLGWKEFNY